MEGNTEQTPESQLINPELLEDYLTEHNGSLPTVEEIVSLNDTRQLSPLTNEEEMGRGM